jgi:hypothetical protein
MRLVSAMVGAAFVLCASAAQAQDRPDFSGNWTVDAEKTAAANPGGMGGGMGGRAGGGGGGGGGGGRGGMGGGGMMGMMGGPGAGPLRIVVDGETMTMTSETPRGATTQTYRLDNSRQTVQMGGGQMQIQGQAQARWEGSTVVVAETFQPPQGNMTITRNVVYSIEGEYLVVKTTTQMPQGEMVRTAYFKRS